MSLKPAYPSYSEWPVEGLLPKEETQAADFIRTKGHDGSGVVIAILDTGVDPGAPGLQVTPDGRPKIINLIDCTGAGDVRCSTVVEAAEVTLPDGKVARQIKGLSGRTLTIGNDWINPSGKYRLGVKATNDIFPKDVVQRLRTIRKREFEIRHHQLLTKVEEDVAAFEKSVSSPATDDQLRAKADHKARFEALKEQWKAWEDSGSVMDCVVFYDGTKWRAAIDYRDTGDLTAVELLADFYDERKFVRFGDDSMLNFSVNIYDEGENLSIVSMAGSHGTHVAAISAAYYPEDPRLNGVAPGAQIISLKIGDTRLGSMETGTGLIRAAIELVRLRVDVANMSYGEPGSPEMGLFIELLRDEVVNKAGCVFVTSAGNAGPALTTAGAPGCATSAIISVGAHVSHTMMEAEYAMIEKVQETPFTWSSRGPAIDGYVGVDIFAPGAAITSVPQFMIKHSQLMNGTSMASPNCAGCVALLLSGLKAEGIPYTPYRIKAALKNTGKDVKDPMNVCFVQVLKAWQHLAAGPNNHDVDYLISCRDGARGIYLRDIDEVSQTQVFSVDVEPKFIKTRDPQQNIDKLALEAKVTLVPSKGWISAPEHLLLMNGGRAFDVQVDCPSLEPGLHFGEVAGYDSSNPNSGPLFSVPITVCKPQAVDLNSRQDGSVFFKYEGLRFSPGTIQRRFITVPAGATYADITLRSKDRIGSARIMVHTVQLVPETHYTRFENKFNFHVSSTGSGDEQTYQKTINVLPMVTMELCLAQFWHSLKETTFSLEIRFHGVLTTISGSTGGCVGATSGTAGDLAYLSSGLHGFSRVDVFAPLRKEVVTVGVKLGTA
ncbi:subtilase family-domain-containing protein [Blyttiomyces helicus]|uniref:Tripeptidyl-peptidase 2 n=1 Tax=Blyttiomyces helicus TaxID=388810 RepID=A0A4P9W5Z0_9FUNG|nr:subtilase family-domain-containing protein [Blyttiomyces helicus]|eukprot:RKO87382.1 subtilase family-domain-containing protein [Blyttiomyces helicus]